MNFGTTIAENIMNPVFARTAATILLTISTSLATGSQPPAPAKDSPAADRVTIRLDDGTVISGTVTPETITVSTAYGIIKVKPSSIRKVTPLKANPACASDGKVGGGTSVKIDEDAKAKCAGRNVAFGKKVTSLVAESPTYSLKRNLGAEKLTDGDGETFAYPGAFGVDYVVDLKKSAKGKKQVDSFRGGYHIDKLRINWGKFGRHFPGERDEKGNWHPASYKADYVNYYRIDYRTSDTASGKWLPLHEHKGRPTDEDAPRIRVVRDPLDASSSEGVVTTCIEELDLADVTEIRIRATGGHWIGIHELEAIQFHVSDRVSSDPEVGNRLVPKVTAANGLVLHYSFDKPTKALDLSPCGNGGIVRRATFTDGHTGGGYYLNGDNQYIGIPNSPSLEVTEAVTIATWAKPQQFPASLRFGLATLVRKAQWACWLYAW